MGLKSTKILGISVTTETKETILEYIGKYLLSSSLPISRSSNPALKPLVIVTPNPEQIVAAHRDKHFADILNQADVAIPDGIGIVIAERFFTIKNQKSKIKKEMQRLPGIELMEDLVRMAAARGYTIGLIGGRGGVAVQALECLQRRYPGLRGWAEEPGELYNNYNSYNYYNCYIKIKKTNTRLVFVGLGAPKQEHFIERLAYHLSLITYRCAVMSVGGAFDMIAGRTPRAPHAIGALGLEWLWRLLREPWRFHRQLRLLQFLWLVMAKKELK